MSGREPARQPRLLGWLLRLLPGDFRSEYGREIAQVFRQQRRDADAPLEVLRLWSGTALGLLGTAAVEHAEVARHDLRYALRSVARAPLVAALAVATLALGIGANTALYGWLEAIVLDPLPGVESPDRLVAVYETDEEGRGGASGLSHLNLLDYRERARSLELAGYEFIGAHLGSGRNTERVDGAIVTGNYFDTLGVRAGPGRTFLPEEDRVPDARRVVVIAHGLWQRRFGGDPGVVGREVTLNGHPFTVVGVAPPGFRGAAVGQRFDLWVPTMVQRLVVPGVDYLGNRNARWLDVVGRLAPDADLAEARAELARIAEGLAREHPDVNRGRRAAVFRPGDAPLGVAAAVTPVLMALAAIVGLVLLIACSNVASVLLARAASRRREIAVRLSLGASRSRLVRQLLTESLLLALLAGVAGAGLGLLANRALLALAPASAGPLPLRPELDLSTLAFTLAVAVLSALVFGLAPALQATRPRLAGALKDGAAPAGGAPRLRGGLVAAQVCLSAVALVSAGLFLDALERARAVDPGFDAEGVLMASLDVFPAGLTPEAGRLFYRRLIEEIEALPGVESATLARRPPLTHRGPRGVWIEEIEGYDAAPDERLGTLYDTVGPRYLETLRIPLRAGRDITGPDASGQTPVVVVNESFADRYWPGESPLGRGILMRGERYEIVGVAADVRQRRLLGPPIPYLFTSQQQVYEPDMTLLVRSAVPPETLAAAVREVVTGLAPDLPVFDVLPMRDHVERALALPRLASVAASSFGLLALVLAAVGLYGVVSYRVSQLAHAIGVRLALGARSDQVFGMVCAHALRLTGLGLALGLPLALAVARFLSGVVPGLGGGEWRSLAASAGILLATALAASLRPALRAAQVDPVDALRCE